MGHPIRKKSQVLLSDFAFSLAIFILIIGAITYIQYNLYIESNKYRESYESYSMLNNLAYKILYYEGTPKNWNLNNIETIGFSTSEDHIINYTKLLMLKSMNYEKSKQYMLEGEDYDYYINITYMNGSTVFQYGKFPFTSLDIFKQERLGILNNTIVKVKMYVWK